MHGTIVVNRINSICIISNWVTKRKGTNIFDYFQCARYLIIVTTYGNLVR